MANQISVEELLSKNQRFKDLHVGERCFILGNGPSLKDVDLSLLADEFVFTVNYFSFVDGYEKVKMNVHVATDPAFFEIDNSRLNIKNFDRTITNYKAMIQDNPKCFVPIHAYQFIKQNSLDKLFDFSYLACNLGMGAANHAIDNPIYMDISRPITCYATVIQTAITIAIYMGFKEIYLLGCDSTYVMHPIDEAIKRETQRLHAYNEKNEDTKKLNDAFISKHGLKGAFFEGWVLFTGYEKLTYICYNLLNIKLINCSSRTIIDSVPRMDLMEVLSKKR